MKLDLKNIILKDFQKDFVDDLINILFDAYQDYPEYGEPDRASAKRYIKWLAKHSTLFKVVFEKNLPVGFLVVDTNWIDKFDKKQVGEIHELAIRKNVWGKGIGKNLLKLAFNHINEKNLDTVRLWVGEKNKQAIEFYKKNGFYPILQGWGWLRMEKRL